MMMTIFKPDVALFVTEHPVWLHSDLQTLVEPGWRKYIRRLRHILINVYICRYICIYIVYIIPKSNAKNQDFSFAFENKNETRATS